MKIREMPKILRLSCGKNAKMAETDIGRSCFVSCWTKQSDEIITMWEMYGNKKHGVRIGFENEDIFDPDFVYHSSKGNTKRLFELDQKSRQVLPEFFDIVYKDDIPEAIQTDFYEISFDGVGRFKSKDWSFQKESRFRFFAARDESDGKMRLYTSKSLQLGTVFDDASRNDERLYFKLRDGFKEAMYITKGPEMSRAEEELFDGLVKKYKIDEGIITDSKFQNYCNKD